MIDLANKEVLKGEQRISLSRSEMDILSLLAHHKCNSLSSQQILDILWSGKPGSKQLVKVHVMNLRKKLESLSSNLAIASSKSEGYSVMDMLSNRKDAD